MLDKIKNIQGSPPVRCFCDDGNVCWSSHDPSDWPHRDAEPDSNIINSVCLWSI